jgi:hypothetical protein
MPDTADTFVPRADVRTASGRLARIDWELRRRLVDEGLVVRGHDVARVVGIATGQHIEWRP